MEAASDEAELRVRAEVGPVLRNFCARRSALIKALTDVVKQLCLYGDTNGWWRLAPRPEDIPPGLPEPVLGINLFRDGVSRDDWLNSVALGGDIWLLSLAFYEGTRSGFGKKHRKELHKKINQLPKVLEIATIRRKARAQVQRTLLDFTARRRALMTALTDEAYEFYWQCDPNAGILCLLGDTNGLWRVGPRDVNVRPGLPEPVWGFNLFRPLMQQVTWLYWVARCGDSWLRALASFEAANNIGLHQADRQRLHDMIEQLPTYMTLLKHITVSEVILYVQGLLKRESIEHRSVY